jgi:hypothetical protein
MAAVEVVVLQPSVLTARLQRAVMAALEQRHLYLVLQ